MNRPLVWWIGLILFVFGAFGAIVPPENYPGWYARAWGITHPYTTDRIGSSAGVNAQIWTGRGVKGIGGETRLELQQPALRQEAADADSRVDGRAQHRTWMLFLAMIGLFLMILGYLQRDRESDDRRLDRLEHQPTPKEPDTTEGAAPQSERDTPSSVQAQAPLESVNNDSEPDWWTKLWAPFHRNRHENRRPIVAAPLEPVTIKVVVESEGEEGKTKAKHVLTANLPPMTVHAVEAHLKVGANDTVQQMDLNVR